MIDFLEEVFLKSFILAMLLLVRFHAVGSISCTDLQGQDEKTIFAISLSDLQSWSIEPSV